jgi:3-dehydroquinate synthase
LHGEAIAIGMICEAYLSHKYNGLGAEELQEIVRFVRKVFPDYELRSESFSDLIEEMKNDNNNSSGKIGFSLLTKIGHCSYNHYLEEDKIREALSFYQELVKS